MSDELNQASTNDLTATPEPSEKLLRQSEVNEIVGREKREAAARAVEQYKKQHEAANYGQQPASQEPTQSTSWNEERVRRMAAEEAQRLRDEWINETQSRNEQQRAEEIVKNFYDKVQAGKTRYDDFDTVTQDVEIARFPNTVHLLSQHIDNVGDVLYELSKNRAKMAQIEITAREFPREALHDLKRLSDSIKSNEQAGNQRQAPAPLSQQRPSHIGTDSGSNALSFRDLKAKYKA